MPPKLFGCGVTFITAGIVAALFITAPASPNVGTAANVIFPLIFMMTGFMLAAAQRAAERQLNLRRGNNDETN